MLRLVSRKLMWLREPRLLRPWALRIASREAWRHMTRDRSLQPLSESLAQSLVDPHAEEEVRRQLETLSVERLVITLPPAARPAIGQNYVEELTVAETAAVLEIPPGTAKFRLSYGLSQSRTHLAKTALASAGDAPLGRWPPLVRQCNCTARFEV